MTTSGTMPRSMRPRSIPTWVTPWLPPPERTKAVRGPRWPRGAPPATRRERQLRSHVRFIGRFAARLAEFCGASRTSVPARPTSRENSRNCLRKSAPAYTPPVDPKPGNGARVTEFYRQYLAVAVFVVAAMGMVAAMLGVGRLLRPTRPQPQKYISYESGSDPLPLIRPDDRPLLHLRPAVRDLRRRGPLRLPVGRSRPSRSAGSASSRSSCSSPCCWSGSPTCGARGCSRGPDRQGHAAMDH